MNPPTPYPELNGLLEQFALQARAALGAELIGLYLVGSFALGDFDENSDVDFLCVTRDELTTAQEAAIRAMHMALYESPISWVERLEGSYIGAARLRREADGSGLLYLDHFDQAFSWSDHCNKAVIRWTLYHYGIALHGPAAKTLLEPITPDDLRLETRQTLRSWLEFIHNDPRSLETREAQTYAVITHCRMLYTLAEGAVASKPVAVAWALSHLDSSWAGLIERAWADRSALKINLPANLEDVKLTLEFVGYANTLSG